MAKSKYPTIADMTVQTEQAGPQPAQQTAPDEREMVITFWPRAFAEWEGSAAQLRDEGLIPEDTEWPTGKSPKHWDAGGFSYWLRRCRPSGIKGPMSVWVNGDWWGLRRTLTASRGTGFSAAEVYEKRCAYEDALWRQSSECSIQSNLGRKARDDKKFQSFMANAKGEGESCKQKQTDKSAMG